MVYVTFSLSPRHTPKRTSFAALTSAWPIGLSAGFRNCSRFSNVFEKFNDWDNYYSNTTYNFIGCISNKFNVRHELPIWQSTCMNYVVLTVHRLSKLYALCQIQKVEKRCKCKRVVAHLVTHCIQNSVGILQVGNSMLVEMQVCSGK